MREEYDIRDEPVGETYRGLLRYATRFCGEFLLIVTDTVAYHSVHDLLGRLSSWLMSRDRQTEWPGTVLSNGTAEVHRFRLTEGSRQVLETAADSLFAWQQPGLPEDLCLLRFDGSPWLVTIAHERAAYLQLSASEAMELAEQLPGLVLSRVPLH